MQRYQRNQLKDAEKTKHTIIRRTNKDAEKDENKRSGTPYWKYTQEQKGGQNGSDIFQTTQPIMSNNSKNDISKHSI